MDVRYPRKFEMFRLEAMGDPPFFDDDEAHIEYLDGHAVTVIPGASSASGKPAWHLVAGPEGHRYSLTFYSECGTPVREVTWEREGDRLFLRRTKDLFYPDGDPGRRVPFAKIVSVTREFSTDGPVSVVLSAPGKSDASRQVDGIPGSQLTVGVPEFGAWEELLGRSTPPHAERFGSRALAEAKKLAAAPPPASPLPGPDAATTSGEDRARPAVRNGWQVGVTGSEVVDRVMRLLQGQSVDLLVLDRGDARVVPLAVQADPGTGRDPHEEYRRMRSLADVIDMDLERHGGAGIGLRLDGDQRTPTIDAYVASLRAADVRAARFWGLRNHQAVVLVWSGDETDGTLQLCLHLVPASWVSDRHEGGPAPVDLRWDADSVQATKEKDA